MEQEYDGVEPDRSREENTGALRSAVRRSIAVGDVQPGPRGEMYNTFGQGFSRAFELAVTPVLFGAMGYGLDRWLGTLPLFTAIVSLLALVAMLLRTWYGYCYRMEAIEAQGPWARNRASAAIACPEVPDAGLQTEPAACPNAEPAACPNAEMAQ